MKIKGKKIEGPNEEIIAIPRGNDEDIIFVAKAVLDQTPFEKMCPLPVPPKRKIDGEDVPNLKDPAYVRQVNRYAEKKMAWLVLTSLEATEELEWEQVDISDPSTWLLFRKELQDSGFSDVEINRIISGVVAVNALSEAKIEAARERFLLTKQARLDESSSQKDD